MSLSRFKAYARCIKLKERLNLWRGGYKWRKYIWEMLLCFILSPQWNICVTSLELSAVAVVKRHQCWKQRKSICKTLWAPSPTPKAIFVIILSKIFCSFCQPSHMYKWTSAHLISCYTLNMPALLWSSSHSLTYFISFFSPCPPLPFFVIISSRSNFESVRCVH